MIHTPRVKHSGRYATHEVVDGLRRLPLHVVEIADGSVSRIYPLAGELPFTEWLPGEIEIEIDALGRRIALWNGILLQ